MYIYFSVFPTRIEKKRAFAVFTVVSAVEIAKHVLLFDYMTVRTLLQWVMDLATIAILFKGSFFKKVAVYLGYFCVIGLSETLFVCFIGVFLRGKDLYGSHEMPLLQTIACFTFATIGIIAYVQFLKRKNDAFEKKSMRYVTMYMLVQALLIFLVYAIMWDYRMNALPILLIYIAVIGVSVGFGVALIRLVKASAAETARAEQIEAQMKLSDEHFKRLQLQYEQYRKLRHDYYNHVSTIKGIKDEAERDAYIDDLTKQIESHRGITFCSNAAVDALLFNEKAQADKVGVKIEFKIADLDSLTISSIDLCTILSNLIDNAIRGASEVDGEDKRFVSVSVFPRAGQLIVNVRNGSLPPKEDLSTTKKHAKDGEHGLGLTIVREVAERHGGAAVYSFSDGVFEASVSVCE